MSAIYDNWERLVRATLRREDLLLSAQRTPSDISTVSESPSFNFSDPSHSASSFNISSSLVGDSFTYHQNLQATNYISGSNLIKHRSSNVGLKGALVSAVAQELVKELALANQDQGQYALQFPTRFRILEEELKIMQVFISEASKLKENRETVRTVLPVLRELIYEADDLVLDSKIRDDYRKMKGASGFFLYLSEIYFRYQTGKKLTEINTRIKRTRDNLKSYYTPSQRPSSQNGNDTVRRWTAPVINQSEVVGLKEDAAKVRGWILGQNEPLLHLAIVGLGGLGKTTLAKMIYRDVNLKRRFQEKIWVSFSQPVKEDEIMKSMLKQLNADGSGSPKGDMLSTIHGLLSDKAYLIVLDDVWSTDDGWWERISGGLPVKEGHNSCIIITSRIKTVVKNMGVQDAQIHQPRYLNDEESWKLFCKVARVSEVDEQNTKLVEEGKEIVKKCGGLPLAIKTVGGLLSSEERSSIKWRRIRETFHEKLTSMGDNCSEGNGHVIASLQLSYDELPAFLKPCILCFLIYPENYEVDADQLIRLWVGEGFVSGNSTETVTESALKCLSELISRCLVEVAQRRNYDGSVYTCKVHDMVRDLTIKIAREEDFCSFDANRNHIADVGSRRLGVTQETKLSALRGNSKLRALLLTTTHYIGFNRKTELAKIKSLRVLDLSHARLDYVFVKDLWDWITSLKRLVCLSLRDVAQLLEVPNSIGKLLGLQVLILGECKDLKKLPTSIINLPRLIILDVGNCPSLRCLPQGFSKLSKLQELYGFKIAGTGKASGSHLAELKAVTELRVLQIDITEDSTIEDQELEILAQLEKLKILSINAGDCKDKNILSKLNKLSPPSSIEELYLKHYLGETTPAWINPRSLQQLQYLSVENSGIEKMNQEFWGDEEYKWDVKGLCLKFCQRLEVSWEELQSVMPEIRHLEVCQCNLLVSFPC
ncbi:disease resistance RPP13-like protein 4 [Coffea arabica]|uniref:Disease resistance RPP13-like protein 4 n=1 Tax=Coffea arabica TaxID=13443 RepID=A0A6P6SF99_COFAR|nr:disease resistance RPP13-like protein 4 [Coffea arabica]XP_027064163.1 disease resistance RPP13-like protein 4 [Coffea arabica]XP_027064164.1 disease resistance RPP13-like protein 4 [Coffea arabica]